MAAALPAFPTPVLNDAELDSLDAKALEKLPPQLKQRQSLPKAKARQPQRSRNRKPKQEQGGRRVAKEDEAKGKLPPLRLQLHRRAVRDPADLHHPHRAARAARVAKAGQSLDGQRVRKGLAAIENKNRNKTK